VIQHQPDRTLPHLGRKLVRCLACHGSTFSRVGASDKPGAVHSDEPVTVEALSRKDGVYRVVGLVNAGTCAICGMAFGAIKRAVPIELRNLVCDCGSQDFSFSIQSLKLRKTRGKRDWRFELDVKCKRCDVNKFQVPVLDWQDVQSIEVDSKNVTIKVKSP
jgi:hypothetical protein